MRACLRSLIAFAASKDFKQALKWRLFFLLALMSLSSSSLQADTIGEVMQTHLTTQAIRFFSFQDPSLRYVLMGTALLGVTCGTLGSWIVVRKMALVGDTLSHAVLPGVALGFLWNMTKDPVAIFTGAVLSGLIGVSLVRWIEGSTPIKQDAALGIVLSLFFAIGICLVTMIQRLPTATKSGLDKFLFGQAAAMGAEDVLLMSIIALGCVLAVFLGYKELLATSFDSNFAAALGLPTRWIHHALMLGVSFAVVIALQAVGVVLVSSMLIIPAATAFLLTDRMQWMLFWAACFGIASGLLGAFLSFLANSLPTGPLIVLSAGLIFLMVFVFAPRYGLLARWWRRHAQLVRVERENTLKAIYHLLEEEEFRDRAVSLEAIAGKRRKTIEETGRAVKRLHACRLARFDQQAGSVVLTPVGWQRACEIVRNHRLWELYLTHAASIAADHVHDDAEIVEHILGEEAVHQIEQLLRYPHYDPHGKPIPSLRDIASREAPIQQYTVY